MNFPSFQVKTFGCKVNTYDTGLIQKQLIKAGFVFTQPQKPSNPSNPSLSPKESLHILNSCAVTAQATQEVIREARGIKSKNPLATVVLTGCAAQVDGEILDSLPDIDLVVANSHKNDLALILEKYFRGDLQEKIWRSNIFRHGSLGEGGGEVSHRTRSYLKIQDGCNSFCRFCIIPFARGKSRSLPIPMILNKIRELEEKQIKEVVLTGVHIGDYVDEITYGGPFHLDDLVEQVLNQSQIPRIRLTSLEPIELTPKLMDLYHHPRMCPHFHMSVQSLSHPVLKAMKRNYSSDQVGESLQWIQQEHPKAFVGMDVIVGFPTETQELFEESMENLRRWPWTRIHVFPYSERKGTAATQMEGRVPWATRKHRAKLMRELSSQRYDQLAQTQVGEEKEVLLLHGKKSGGYHSLSEDYWKVRVQGAESFKPGTLRKVRLKDYCKDTSGGMNGFLIGEALPERRRSYVEAPWL